MFAMTTVAKRTGLGADVPQRALRSLQYRSSQLLAAATSSLLPTRMVATVKRLLVPTTRLDYERTDILISADSEMDFARATPCRKEPGTVRWIEATLKPGDVFYDIGANIGSYAMIAAVQAPGEIKSYAFEPSFSTFNQLCKNVILNGYQDVVFPYLIAVGPKTEVSVFNYQSVAAGASLHAAGQSVDFQGRPFEPVYRQQVLAFSLDDLVFLWGFDVPNHIKIDVDGSEFDLLLGARKLLGDPRLRSLLIEVCHDRGHTDSIRELMAEHGFDLESELVIAQGVSNCVFTRSQ